MSDLPTVVEDSLEKLQALQRRAEESHDKVKAAPNMVLEWQNKLKKAQQEMTPKGDSLAKRLKLGEQELTARAGELRGHVKKATERVKEWSENLSKGLAEDLATIEKLQEQLKTATRQLQEMETRLQSQVQSAKERMQSLIQENLSALTAAENSTQEAMGAMVAARNSSKQQSEALRQRLGEEQVILTEKAAKVHKSLADFQSGLVERLARTEESGINNLKTALASLSKEGERLPSKSAEEIRITAQEIETLNQEIKEQTSLVSASDSAFQETAGAAVPQYLQLATIPPELQQNLKAVGVVVK